MNEHLAELEYDDEKGLKALLKTVDLSDWIIVNRGEGCTQVYRCPSKKDVEDFLKAIHEEGSHTDHDTYEIYHARKQYDYKVSVQVI